MPLAAEPDLRVKHSNRFSFQANRLGRRLTMYFSMDKSLWYWNTNQEAEDFDEAPGCVVVAQRPAECIQFIKSCVAQGPQQERLLEMMEWISMDFFWERRRERSRLEAEAWERRVVLERSAYFERLEQMNAEATADESEVLENFPLETNL